MTVLLDATKPSPTQWVRGAHLANLETELSAPADPSIGGRHPLPKIQDWCSTLGRWGIGKHSRVIVYDRQDGGMAAARAWWMLRAVGHTHIEVRDATEVQGERTDQLTPAVDGPAYPAAEWRLPTVSMAQVKERRRDPNWRVIDARSAPRFRGEIEPIDPVAGHIDGALNVPWQETTDLSVAKARLTQALGDVPPERTIVHCGSGVTACHTLLQLHRLGLDGAQLYVGSWSEWCRRSVQVPESL
ncbi:MAG: sulfurtransferase [Myxococcota bacterium]